MGWLHELVTWFSHVGPSEDASCVRVTIAKGDTLSGLAQKWAKDGNRWPEFAAVNPGRGFDNPDTILQIGESVNIPKNWGGV